MRDEQELTDFEVRAIDTFDQGFWDGLRPDPILSVSEWSDEHRVLSNVGSAEPGRWRTSRTPYLREIQDSLSIMSPIQKVVFIKGAQIGGTEAGNNWIGYVIDHAPGPMMMVLGSLEVAKRNAKTRIKALIDDCPRLRERVKATKSKDGGNTILQKEFPGGVLVMSGANSAMSLRSMPVRFLMLDEVDGYPDDVQGEGDPVVLAEARTRTFSARKKIYLVSTPTFEGRSKIQRAYNDSDQRRYHVPCPHCKGMQWLKWSQIKWPENEPEKAQYFCEHCQKPIPEHHKTWMLANGRWIADKPGAGGGKIAGFHISALYSPLGLGESWTDFAVQWVKAQGKPEEMRGFLNTVLGETWKESSEAPEWEILYQRRETYAMGVVPDKVVFLTAGVDVQANRLECEIVGWCRNKSSYSIQYLVIPGDTGLDASEEGSPWAELDQLLSKTWQKSSGQSLMIRRLAVDSGFNTQHVYNWVRRHPQTKVMAVKGMDQLQLPVGMPTAVDVVLGGKGGKKIKRGLQLWPMGSSVIKGELYSWLKLKPPTDEAMAAGKDYPHGYCHFPQYQEEYFKQLTAEQLVVRIVKKRRKYEWEKTRDRNEALDCRVMARAAAYAVGMDRFGEAQWLALAESAGIEVSAPRAQAPAEGSSKDVKPESGPQDPPPPRRRSSFL